MKYLIAIFLLAIPTSAFAATAGTDEYLRELGYTDTQLSTEVVTEDREAFFGADGIGRIEDPIGDVVTRFGTTSEIREPWGDISLATVAKNEETQAWDVTVTLGGAIPETPGRAAQLFVYLDADGDASNNAPDGIRIGTDAEFSVQYDATNGWYADFRWYNANAIFWAVNKDTAATFDVVGDTVTVHIPFAEAPSTLTPRWRVAMAVADGSETQIDVAPGTGFPPPKGETYPGMNGASDPVLSSVAWSVLILALVLGARYAVAKKRRK